MSELVNLSALHTLVPIIWPLKPAGSNVIPGFVVKCPAGFPSPAADYVESGLDLHEYLVKHRAATFIFDVCGDSMINAGILDGDKIVVDRAVEARHGCIIVAILNGEHTVKRLHVGSDGIELQPENPRYALIRIQAFVNRVNLNIGRELAENLHDPSTHVTIQGVIRTGRSTHVA